MGEAIGQVLVLGVAVALSPLAIVAVTLMITSGSGRPRALAFLAGWALGLAALGTAALLLADGIDANRGGAPADWASVVKIAAAVLLLFVAARQWRSEPGEKASPGWMETVGSISPFRAAAVALPISALKPKNLLLTVSVGLSIAETGAAPAGQAVALAVFVLLGTLGPATPAAIHLLMPARAPEVLAGLRGWMVREQATIIAVLCLIVAVKLIGDAVGALTT